MEREFKIRGEWRGEEQGDWRGWVREGRCYCCTYVKANIIRSSDNEAIPDLHVYQSKAPILE